MKRRANLICLSLRNLLVVGSALLPAATVVGAEWTSLEKATPADLYGEKCGMCHRMGGMGTGLLGRRMSAELALLENRGDLQPAFIETAVRSGLGVMFPLSRGELSDAQLQGVIGYLVKDAGVNAGVNKEESR